MRCRVFPIVLLISPFFASLYGCTEKETPSQPETRAEAPEENRSQPETPAGAPSIEGTLLSDVIASWESDDKDNAVEQLRLLRWGDPDVFANIPVMSLSEGQFGVLSADERARLQKDIAELAGTLKSLARHANATGDKAQASGDSASAKAYYEAALHLGEAFSSPERVLVLQLSGKGIAIAAQEKLDTAK